MTNTKRILIKISWETFKNNKEDSFDYEFMQKLWKTIKILTKQWYQIVLITWGGNIFRGAQQSKGAIDTATWHYIGMLATLMNWIVFGDILERLGQETRVLSSISAPKVVATFNRKDALRHLKKNRLVIATAGTGNPYCTNDLAAVIRAKELNCEFIIKATKVDWIYDKDPIKNNDATKFNTITHKKAYELWLNIMDHSAIATAMDNNIPIFVCKVEDLNKFWTKNEIWSRLK